MSEEQAAAPVRRRGPALITYLVLGLCPADLVVIFVGGLGTAAWTLALAGCGLGIGAVTVERARRSGSGLGFAIAGLSFASMFLLFLGIWHSLESYFDNNPLSFL
jgi:hypothetical protein